MIDATGPRQPLIRAHRLSRLYADGAVQALCDVSLSIHRGEYVALVGPSGSGNSTLLNLLGAIDRPSSGEIYFAGEPLSRQSDLAAYRARQIGFVFQSFLLLPTLTAWQNVQIPLFESPLSARQRADKAARLLAEVGLADRAEHLPGQLSVGQRQRVAIARALANDPPLILADEPTGNLDSQSGGEVLALLDRLHRQGTTLLVITHSAEVAARSQRIVSLRDGRLVDDRPSQG